MTARLVRLLLSLAAAALVIGSGPRPPAVPGGGNQSLPVWRVAKEYEIGRAGLGLMGPVGVVIARGGAVVVLDRSEPFVRVHGANGRGTAEFIRRGGGPGELQSPGGMGWRGDSIWVYDFAQHRLTLFNQEGKYLRSRPISQGAIPGSSGVRPIALLANGGVMVQGSNFADDPTPSGGATTPVAIIESSSGRVRTIARVASVHRGLRFKVLVEGSPGESNTDQPFSDDPLLATPKDGSSLVVVDRQVPPIGVRSAFTITVLNPGGDTIARNSVPYQPLPLNRSELDGVVSGLLRAVRIPIRGGPKIEGDEADLRAALYRPRFLPPAFSLNVGRDGTIWLRTNPVTDAGGPPADFSIFDRNGKPLAKLSIPPADQLRLLEADAGHLWVATVEDDGTPLVVGYRIVR